MRQLKCPSTEPSAERVTSNPNCENGCSKSVLPLPPPFATVGPPAVATAGMSAQAAAKPASAPKNRFMLSPFSPGSAPDERGYYPLSTNATSWKLASFPVLLRLLPSEPSGDPAGYSRIQIALLEVDAAVAA